MPSSTPFDGFQDTLVQLPNKDLWRGSRVHLDVAERPDTIDNTPDPTPAAQLDGAMSAVVAAAKGAHELTCLWCGKQISASRANDMKEHIASNHMLAVAKPSNEQALAVMLAGEQIASNDSA